ncbi:hypothetical protein DNH61_07615 [Paenibacillus sambharensis]|uniref:Lipoprotein n=2 Tax=Paenibacillus sambharensis TaxID=1803190 RepID=A0A2W1LN03_9BACL|nr:DUF6612 family protein [Paenibacillus sambharensis]PZD96372.1 hypothetical protein DNH61_07615 [Paenibacillus sambharensis]
MKMKQWMKSLLLMGTVLVILAGCSKPEAPKEAIQSSMTKAMDMNSYTFAASMGINELELPESITGAQDQAILDMIKNASLNVTGVYQADPMQMEFTMDVELKGDMSMKISVPVVMTQDKIWVKIPNIPGFPLGELAGQFVEMDMKELAAESGVEMPTMDIDKQRKMGQDMANVFFKHFEEDKYFTELKKEDVAGLPEDIKADQIVKFYVTQETFEPMVMTVVDKVAPEIIELLLNNEEYRNMLQVTKEDLEAANQELKEGDRSELREALDEFKKDVTVNEISLTTVLEKELPVYQTANLNFGVTQEGESMKIGMNMNVRYDNINEKVEFKIGIPTDALTVDEVEEMFMTSY